jgi:Pyruvate/2-oxoacid:ferredoxin oxidoreductase delta subunit
MARRKIIRIDEGRCTGCGLCVPGCAEGALQVIDGKAKLVAEVYCDGLGACLGECPEGAISIEERDAAGFDEHAVEKHLSRMKTPVAPAAGKPPDLPCGCPGSLSREIRRPAAPASGASGSADEAHALQSRLANWPVQIALVPERAPYLDGARLLIAADCTPFAFADFHRRFVSGRTVLVGCPKLDDAAFYQEKLASIIRANEITGVDVVTMEVPCCSGLVRLVRSALSASGKDLPATFTRIGVSGDLL